MASRQKLERTRVMIVEQDWDFGIRLADWLAAHGYQPVLIRSVDAAMAELSNIHPKAIFFGLAPSEPAGQIDIAEVLLLIQTICPHVPAITIVDQSSEDLAQVVFRQGVRRFLVKPVEFSQIGHVLQSELSAAGA
jgi:DNA-binding NtrC family response regulator